MLSVNGARYYWKGNKVLGGGGLVRLYRALVGI